MPLAGHAMRVMAERSQRSAAIPFVAFYFTVFEPPVDPRGPQASGLDTSIARSLRLARPLPPK